MQKRRRREWSRQRHVALRQAVVVGPLRGGAAERVVDRQSGGGATGAGEGEQGSVGSRANRGSGIGRGHRDGWPRRKGGSEASGDEKGRGQEKKPAANDVFHADRVCVSALP